MAKRKRLTPANPDFQGTHFEGPAPETKSMAPLGGMRAPIADVASEASATAALQELSREMQTARREGRMITALPLSDIRLDHLVRDRLPVHDADMAALVASLRERGQQTPVEVVALAEGGYGLISGWRRCTALAQLHSEGQGTGTVLAIERRPDDAADAYLAMVEENEIRVGLSYFERARIAVKSVDQGVFETEKQALLSLFRSASRAKRSKIRSFLGVVRALDGVLQFPQTLGERTGLLLSAALAGDDGFALRTRVALERAAPQTPEAEAAVLADLLKKPAKDQLAKTAPEAAFAVREIYAGLTARVYKDDGRLEVSGPALTPELRADLLRWLERHVPK